MNKLPYFTPLGWSIIFGVSVGVGVWIAIQMLMIRGLW